MRTLWILSLCVLLLASSAIAMDINVTASPVTDKIYADESAEYMLRIANNANAADDLVLFSTDPLWRVYYTGTYINLDGKSTKDIRVILDPVDTITQAKVYGVPISIRSTKDEAVVMYEVPVTINSERYRNYLPSVSADISVGTNNEIDPTESFDVVIKVINKNPLDIDPVFVSVQSPLFSDEFSTKLDGNDIVTKTLTYKIDPLTKPQELTVSVTLRTDKQQLGMPFTVPVKIKTIQPGLVRKVISDNETFLHQVYVVQLRNVGNVQTTEKLKFESNLIQRLFMSSNVGHDFETVDGKYYAVFTVTLAPNTGIELVIEKNYQPFFWTVVAILAIIVLSLIFYYVYRPAIILKRKILHIHHNDDGVSHFKVVVNIKNRTSKLIENVRVLERTPNIIEVSKEFAMGTLKPSKILANPHKGTLVRWDFSTLEPYEERIITYNLHSKLTIVGGKPVLPATIVKYDSFGHTRTVTSNSVMHRAAKSEDEE